MKAVIPAKNSSTRVRGKNFRPFHGADSLLDIKLRQLTSVLPASDIYVSTEDPQVASNIERWGANLLLRDTRLAANEVNYPEVVSAVCADVPGDDDILWCHVTDPLFDRFTDLLNGWRDTRETHDCLVVVYPLKAYLLDEGHRPMGFGFGPWHTPSQQLPTRYQLAFTASVLHRDTALRWGPIGAKPSWFHAANQVVDVDTEQDFLMAQAVYGFLCQQQGKG